MGALVQVFVLAAATGYLFCTFGSRALSPRGEEVTSGPVTAGVAPVSAAAPETREVERRAPQRGEQPEEQGASVTMPPEQPSRDAAFPHAFFGLPNSDVEKVPEREDLPLTDVGGSCGDPALVEAVVGRGSNNLRERALKRFDQSLFLSEWTQFWQVSGQFFQVRLVWEMDDPPTYRLEAYQSPDPEMRSAARDEHFWRWISSQGVSSTGRYPLDALFRLVLTHLKERIADGALLGTRFARVVLDRHTDAFREIMFEDSRVVALRARAVSCTAVPHGGETDEGSASAAGAGLRLACGCALALETTNGSLQGGAAQDAAGGMP